MFLIENIRLALSALVTNKMRSLLTMLGIIIGISAVITITTIGNSLQKTLSNTFSLVGANGYYLSYSGAAYSCNGQRRFRGLVHELYADLQAARGTLSQ